MPRNPTRPLLPALTLITLTLLAPIVATALPHAATLHSATERAAATPGLFSSLWELLSVIWTTGSGLEPDGAKTNGSDPNASGTGDTGSILEPNG